MFFTNFHNAVKRVVFCKGLHSIICVLLFVFCSLESCLAKIEFCHQRYRTDHRLNATVFASFFSLSELDCVASCVQGSCCRSVNYKKTAKYNEENCEMIYDQWLDKNLIPDNNYDYFILRVPEKPDHCACHECKHGGRCDKETKSCACDAGFYGKQCELKVATLITGYFTLDNFGSLYVDGKKMGDASSWQVAIKVQTYDNYTEILIDGRDDGGVAAAIASFSNGLVTDTSWECKGQAGVWEKAVSYGRNDDSSIVWYGGNGGKIVSNIAPQAQWIWTSEPQTDDQVLCRKLNDDF